MSCCLGIFVWHINHTYTVASTPSMIKFGSYERFRLFLSSVASHVYLDNDFIAANLIWNFFLFCINQPANWENFYFYFPKPQTNFTTANLVNIKFLVYIYMKSVMLQVFLLLFSKVVNHRISPQPATTIFCCCWKYLLPTFLLEKKDLSSVFHKTIKAWSTENS